MTDGSGEPPSLPSGPPDVETWMALSDDLFGRLVPHVRRALVELEGVQETPEVRRLRAVPAAKLGRGRSRRRLLGALAEGGPLWVLVRTRAEGDPDLARDLGAALAAGPAPAPRDASDDMAAALAAARRSRDDLRDQRDLAREERDAARRQRDGALGRERSVRGEVEGLRATAAELSATVDALRDDVARAAADVAEAVAREARRGAAAREDLVADLAAARREVDTLRRERARREDSSTGSHAARSGAAVADARGHRGRAGRVVAGRPSRLPSDARVDTREGALLLLRAVPTVLVDGYNVTRTHRGDLDLAAQRDWLVNGLATLAARLGSDVTVVFDAHLDGRASGSARGPVHVRYSHPGVTADDEIVLAVEVLERHEPVVVVTDDRELRQRLAPSRVDVLPTASLAGLVR